MLSRECSYQEHAKRIQIMVAEGLHDGNRWKPEAHNRYAELEQALTLSGGAAEATSKLPVPLTDGGLPSRSTTPAPEEYHDALAHSSFIAAPAVAAPAEGKNNKGESINSWADEYLVQRMLENYARTFLTSSESQHNEAFRCRDEVLRRMATPPIADPQWRVGKQVPLNVYEGDRPVCQCHTEEDARRIVEAVNGRS